MAGPLLEMSPEQAEHVRATAAGMEERQRRLYLGGLAESMGRGGVAAVSRASGVCRKTVSRGKGEVRSGEAWHRGDRSRRPGGGRRTCAERFASRERAEGDGATDLVDAARAILAEHAYGDPCDTGMWANMTAEGLSREISRRHSFEASVRSCSRLAREAGYSLQHNRKLDQAGPRHPLREAQFLVREEVLRALSLLGIPVVSVDTKAKVMLGPFAAGGREWMPEGMPRGAFDHDFGLPFSAVYPSGHPELPGELMGRKAVAVPYGVYDVGNNTAHCVVGVSSDTSEFAGRSLVAWWAARGRDENPGAVLHGEVAIEADCGGSDRSSGWLYKLELARAAGEMGLSAITVVHLPPGTSKYNPIEHRLWSQVSIRWAGKPMGDVETVAGYIAHTTTSTGLSVSCDVDWGVYLTERAKAAALREAGVSPSSVPCARERFEEIAYIERPLSNPQLAQWTYRIVLK